ncbi:MAG: HipA domain-containing protein [Muribaculaceae bacterium]|nr:HipA domain-containing protein [Muribaculaceae bacterium]
MHEINVCPATLLRGYNTYSPQACKSLFDGRRVSHIFSESSPECDSIEVQNAIKIVGRISLSGAQSKFSVVVDEDNKLRYARNSEQGVYILKPRPVGYQIINKDYCGANEHITMQIASQVFGIETAVNALCFFEDSNSPAYITRRFDVHPNGKYKQEDFAALMGYSKDNAGSNYKYDKVSYEDCAYVIQRYVKAAMVDMRRYFRLILFNFVTLNDDAHLKNFSLIERNGEYRLSPAYDLINTSIQIREPRIFALEKGLFKEGMFMSDTNQIKRADFEEFGKRIKLPDKVIKQEIDRFASEQPLFRELLDRSFLSPELKRQYLLSYNYRCKMLHF